MVHPARSPGNGKTNLDNKIAPPNEQAVRRQSGAGRFMFMKLEGSTAVITGATEGIGRAIAQALGSRGTRIAICARNADRVRQSVTELSRDGVQIVGSACDVSNEESVTSFASFVGASLGPVDILVNNAGVGHMAPVDKMALARFDETMAVNVRGPFLMTRAFLKEMKQRNRGHIVNIVSLAGRNGLPNGTAYSASKHAVLGFSKSLMLELRNHGIRVVAVCPGSVVTPFFDKSGMELQNPERKLQPEDVAQTVLTALELPDRALISELDVRPTNP
jgi:3-oxoacyl-[acyl-carrier protein] reductase